jgi:hypothetical protein
VDLFVPGTDERNDGLISLDRLAAVNHSLDSAINGWIDLLNRLEFLPKVHILGANENSVAHEPVTHDGLPVGSDQIINSRISFCLLMSALVGQAQIERRDDLIIILRSH